VPSGPVKERSLANIGERAGGNPFKYNRQESAAGLAE
jgi:hypothetical protein